jgi:serine/threonine protein kinase
MPPQNDLVTFAQLETSISRDGQTTHTFPDFDTTTQAPTKRREKWRRDAKALGRGAFGVVYREQCTSGRSKGELRAVKVMKKVENVNYERELEAFSVFSQDSLQVHQRFVRSTGWFETADEISIAMELVEHGNLETYLSSQGGKLPELDAQEITRQIFQALKAMHDLNFAHRDLKPGVCIPCTCELVALSDFVLARMF